MNKSFDNNKEYIIEYVMQLKISEFIKENEDMDKELLANKIDEMLAEKEDMYNMTEEQLKEKLKKNQEMEN